MPIPPDVQIHHLGPRDLGLMTAMLAMFGKAFDDVATFSIARPREAYMTRLLRRDDFIAPGQARGCAAF